MYRFTKKPEHKIEVNGYEIVEAALIEAIHKLYRAEPELKKLADKIHSSRMMSPPACTQCIQMAMWQLNRWTKVTVTFE